MNGIWQALNAANWDIQGHAAGPAPLDAFGAIGAVPPGLGVVDGDEIPYQPWARAKRQENFKTRLTADPEIKCYLPGVPRANYMAHPFQIIQSQEHIMMLYQYPGAVRPIYMRDHRETPADSWMGGSNRRWEGETLVVETTGFNGQTWFDRAGNVHSDALRVIERYTASSPDHLDYQVTITDPDGVHAIVDDEHAALSPCGEACANPGVPVRRVRRRIGVRPSSKASQQVTDSSK